MALLMGKKKTLGGCDAKRFIAERDLFQRLDRGDDDGTFGATEDDIWAGWIGVIGGESAYLGIAKKSNISHATAYAAKPDCWLIPRERFDVRNLGTRDGDFSHITIEDDFFVIDQDAARSKGDRRKQSEELHDKNWHQSYAQAFWHLTVQQHESDCQWEHYSEHLNKAKSGGIG